MFVLAVYRRDRRLLGVVLAFVGAQPLLFDEPDDDAAWATRVVRGERDWLAAGLRDSPGDVALLAVGAPLNLFVLRAALRRQPLRTAVDVACSVALSLAFFDRMADRYERVTER
ncbi:hypothetical protein [Halorubellus litoreus]|uniref:Uncharacterized protein n=1 Tax=Halorubellus litoreus TaxID=755308 RepID=A0ABD5VH44_9EURY